MLPEGTFFTRPSEGVTGFFYLSENDFNIIARNTRYMLKGNRRMGEGREFEAPIVRGAAYSR